MCGITLVLSSEADASQKDLPCMARLMELLSRRGPDCLGCHDFTVPGLPWHLRTHASTLWTQGLFPTEQPLVSQSGSLLLWNGDAYNKEMQANGLADSLSILSEIENTGSPLYVLPSICGPYAFIFYDPKTKSVWFGRDPIGRCSLLIYKNDYHLIISSVLHKGLESDEVPSWGVYQIKFKTFTYEMTFHPWLDINDRSSPLDYVLLSSNTLQHKVLNRNVNPDWLQKQPQKEDIYSISEKDPNQMTPLGMLNSLYKKYGVSEVVEHLAGILQESVRLRVTTKPRYCKRCSQSASVKCDHSKVAVLFSGGLDSTILAVMTHKALDPLETIDLLNVAFEKGNSKASDAPDRITGHLALKELQEVAPERKWNFVEISISKNEVDEKINHIADLIHPLHSVLDESLGCALWFASRGEGFLGSDAYESPARIVLVGMGADELFGGYSRHAALFKQTASWAELGQLLLNEVQNIGSRNLGRDNRIISDHGRMMRAPFLDEAFITHVNQLPPWLRCCPGPGLPRGVGDKTLLRMVGLALGLRKTSVQPKRALQFGSRIADSKQKGHQISARLNST